MRTAALVLAIAVPALAAGTPPREGVFVPGASLGGLRLGMTPAQVRAAWGTNYGRCRNCSTPTWYYTYKAFSPEGAGVEFRRGRLDAIFTLWSPPGWSTRRGLRIGDDESRVTAIYGGMSRAVSAFAIVNGRVWGFGLFRAPSRPCR